MALRLEDKWIWDLWLAVDGPDYHVFYLQAPRELGNPELRHRHASIGHAVSDDLRQWEILPDALHPSQAEGAWDDFTTWTGSVIRHEGLWYLFYTGGRRSENALVQRIGCAVSKDIINWERYPGNPVLLCDPERYETLNPDDWYELTWRDPWLMRDESSGKFQACVSARSKTGPTDGRGVIALAESTNLHEWRVLDPVTRPGDFGYMEVPQVVEIDHRFYLLFSTVEAMHSKTRRQRVRTRPETGIFYLTAETPLGPYAPETDACLLGSLNYTFYAGKIVNRPNGRHDLLAMRYLDRAGHFIGEMHDPIPISTTHDGQLVLKDLN